MARDRSLVERVERSPRVLIVDSNDGSAQTLGEWLSEVGFKTVRAKSTGEAIELLRDLVYIEAAFDGLLVEYDLPDATGCRIIHEFRHEFPGIITALLSDTDDIFIEVWSKARRIPILHKPLQKAEFQEWLERFKVPA